MERRVLEILKKPNSVLESDLETLSNQIKNTPYIQSIRAIYLSAIHQYNPELYHKTLGTTAAYTTDKKILYQFINGVTIPKKHVAEVNTESFESEKSISTDEAKPNETLCEATKKELIIQHKEIIVNGEVNRILFEGEETIFTESLEILTTEAIPTETEKSMENTLEQTSDPVEKTAETLDPVPAQEEQTIESSASEVETTTPNEMKTPEPSEIQNTEENSEDISFHNTDDFLPNVTISALQPMHITTDSQTKAPSANNPHEEEMKKLLAEVERKIQEKKKKDLQKKSEIPDITEKEISDTEAQNLQITEDRANTTPNSEFTKEKTVDIAKNWKPMNFSESINSTPIETDAEQNTESIDNQIPVMNVSFFSPQITQINTQENFIQNDIVKDVSAAESVEKPTELSSNVPSFINTWQSWLKIDRSENSSDKKPSKEEIKEKAIEKFLENEPKISQLKEDTTFVVKEKKNDISHLMTETLANLYLQQKLYSKAIKAFEILQEKHPEKQEYFLEKIQEIKDSKNSNNG